jgi:beta-glucanase (GH16 family)
MSRRHRLVFAAAGLAAVGALVAASVTTADATASKYRIGRGIAVYRGSGHSKPSPSPTPTSPPSSPTSTPTSPSPTPTDTTTSAQPSTTDSSDTPTPTPTDPTATPTDPTATPTDPTTTPAGPDCGGTAPLKANGSPWVCTFDDEFDGTSVDRSNWLVQTTAASGFHSGAECFVDSPNNVAVAGGTLRLTVRKESAPFTCTSPSGGYSSQYTSGTINGYGRFNQTYGRFEVRAKLPNTSVKGLQETLWLWPVNSTKYGYWPASGEIDFAEFYSLYNGWNIPYLHYSLLQSTVNWATNSNVYTALPAPNNQPGMTCSYNKGAFNTYTVLWQPGRITLQVNGQNCIVDNYAASNATDAAPFDQPFFLALTQALGVGGNAFVDGTTPLPATTEVDYVRIWQ